MLLTRGGDSSLLPPRMPFVPFPFDEPLDWPSTACAIFRRHVRCLVEMRRSCSLTGLSAVFPLIQRRSRGYSVPKYLGLAWPSAVMSDALPPRGAPTRFALMKTFRSLRSRRTRANWFLPYASPLLRLPPNALDEHKQRSKPQIARRWIRMRSGLGVGPQPGESN